MIRYGSFSSARQDPTMLSNRKKLNEQIERIDSSHRLLRPTKSSSGRRETALASRSRFLVASKTLNRCESESTSSRSRTNTSREYTASEKSGSSGRESTTSSKSILSSLSDKFAQLKSSEDLASRRRTSLSSVETPVERSCAARKLASAKASGIDPHSVRLSLFAELAKRFSSAKSGTDSEGSVFAVLSSRASIKPASSSVPAPVVKLDMATVAATAARVSNALQSPRGIIYNASGDGDIGVAVSDSTPSSARSSVDVSNSARSSIDASITGRSSSEDLVQSGNRPSSYRRKSVQVFSKDSEDLMRARGYDPARSLSIRSKDESAASGSIDAGSVDKDAMRNYAIKALDKTADRSLFKSRPASTKVRSSTFAETQPPRAVDGEEYRKERSGTFNVLAPAEGSTKKKKDVQKFSIFSVFSGAKNPFA